MTNTKNTKTNTNRTITTATTKSPPEGPKTPKEPTMPNALEFSPLRINELIHRREQVADNLAFALTHAMRHGRAEGITTEDLDYATDRGLPAEYVALVHSIHQRARSKGTVTTTQLRPGMRVGGVGTWRQVVWVDTLDTFPDGRRAVTVEWLTADGNIECEPYDPTDTFTLI